MKCLILLFMPSFRKRISRFVHALGWSLVICSLPLHAVETDSDQVGLEHFEKYIRPLLLEKCIDCHGAKKQKGGLRLDSREAMLIGGDSGAVFEAGTTEDALLLSVISHKGKIKMPPKEKLSKNVVTQVSEWIAMGAPDPRKAETPFASRKGIDIEEGRKHWAYQSVREQKMPVVRQRDWPKNEIDFFVLKELEKKGLASAGDANEETWIRRLYYSLAGLPPTPDQLDEFLYDKSANAKLKAVDRLLESPRYGERWARHWLDLVRYGESVTLRGLVYGEAWRYRDYVINSFNRDVPIDQFIKEQISGDLMEADDYLERRRKLIATGFLAFGNHNMEEQNKEALNMNGVDEQLDTIGKAFLGQTIACARCHDHKFDPIPTKDYYAMAGILRSTEFFRHDNVSGWLEVPLPMSPENEKLMKAHQLKERSLKKGIADLKKVTGTLSQATGPIDPKSLPGIVLDDVDAIKVGDWLVSTHKNIFIGKGYLHDDNKDQGKKSLSFEPVIPKAGRYEVLLAYLESSNRSSKTSVSIQSAEGEKTVVINQKQAPPIDGRFVSLGSFAFETNGFSTVLVSNKGANGHVIVDAVIFLPVEDEGKFVKGGSSSDEVQLAQKRLGVLTKQLAALQMKAPVAPKAMVVNEREKPSDIKIHIRGVVGNEGRSVKRGFLQVASMGTPVVVPEGQSGRLQFGEWIGSDDNPLTARVYVNRVWHWMFGRGLVRTPDNFGTTGMAPSHPELLDFLAKRFTESGWSTKALIREIALSRTWGQSSEASSALKEADPQNLLLARSHQNRLEGEMLRDGILQISGSLDLTMGGTAMDSKLKADYGFEHSGTRRSIYSPQLRNVPLEILETFDMANSSFTAGGRNASTVAPQALFLMNHPFVIEEAELAATKTIAGFPNRMERLNHAWRSALGRGPTNGELSLMTTFLSENESTDQALKLAWAQVYQSLFGSIDFRYIP
ncbi:DUF1553 domain-containing protein [Verrucomicrobia bacterium]|nr:DUF1553 domain-containing protein [Verrucomicrobiota bacterium]